MKAQNTKTFLKLLLLISICFVVYLLVINKQNIYDQVELFRYKPPSEISSIASQDGMTSYTRKVFYVNHPKIENKSAFASDCPDNSEQFVVLGCYRLNQHGIYILQVNNSNLAGIEQVTAAYETLHAIYQRLTPNQQSTLNNELLSYEKSDLNNPTVEAQIANFKKTEPGEVLNEMTSLFGTEVQNLSPALNSFYAKYFTNRQKLLSLYNNYQSAFSSRQNQIASYDAQLASMQTTINTNEAQINSQLSIIQSTQSNLNNLKNSNQLDQYNLNVPGYNQEVDSYNALVNTTQNLIAQYNQIVAERNALALEEQQLTQAITSQAKTISN